MAVVRFIDRFPEIIITASSRTAQALDKAADAIETGAKARSRVDTGNMRNGWTQERISNSSRMVFNPVHYVIFHEYGTVNMAAQPMLQPAVEEVRPALMAAVTRAWRGY
jgi:HK97 gp10 family phage protein